MPTCPPDPIVAPAELPQWGVPTPFLSQFRLRPFEIQISTGGPLGTMAIRHRLIGEESWSADVVPSDAGSSWSVSLDDAFAETAPTTFAAVTFPAGEYLEETTYQVSADGAVTTNDGALAGVSSTRIYLPAKGCAAVTDEILQLVQNAITAPLTAWPDSFRRHAAAMVHGFLKRARGASARGSVGGTSSGDDVIFAAEALARDFFIMVGENGKPPGVVDTSVVEDGPMISAYPLGTDGRNWRDAF